VDFPNTILARIIVKPVNLGQIDDFLRRFKLTHGSDGENWYLTIVL